MELVQKLGSFTDEISLTPLRGRNEKWRVNNGFAWHVGMKHSQFHVLVPSGFVYDLASVPLIARPVVPHTTAPQASGLHDYGYKFNRVWVVRRWEKGVPIYHRLRVPRDRKFWDIQFYQGMLALGVHPLRAKAAFVGVRVGGWIAWNRHRANDSKRSNT